MSCGWTPTDDAVQHVIEILESAQCVTDFTRRAVLVTEAQHQLAWALRLAAQDVVDSGVSWRTLGPALGMRYAVLYRQCRSGGPVVAPEAGYMPAELVVGFRTRGGADDSWQVLTVEQAADPRLAHTLVTGGPGALDLTLCHRPVTAAELTPPPPLLWHPALGRRGMLLSPPVVTALSQLVASRMARTLAQDD